MLCACRSTTEAPSPVDSASAAGADLGASPNDNDDQLLTAVVVSVLSVSALCGCVWCSFFCGRMSPTLKGLLLPVGARLQAHLQPNSGVEQPRKASVSDFDAEELRKPKKLEVNDASSLDASGHDSNANDEPVNEDAVTSLGDADELSKSVSEYDSSVVSIVVDASSTTTTSSSGQNVASVGLRSADASSVDGSTQCMSTSDNEDRSEYACDSQSDGAWARNVRRGRR